MKGKLLVALALALGTSTTALGANPFSDVPAGHWAYASVARLAASGLLEGYPDGTLQGGRTMTRYEMAQIVAKALAKGAIGADDKMVDEFAAELHNLGVRVARLEKHADNFKITGEARLMYMHSNQDTLGDGDRGYNSELRTRINLTGHINERWNYTGMLENTQDLTDNEGNEEIKFHRAYLEGSVGALQLKGGRYDPAFAQGLVLDSDGDSRDGLEIGLGEEEKISGHLFYGKMADDTDTKYFGAELQSKQGKTGLHGGFYKFTGDTTALGDDGSHIWNVGAGYTVGLANLTADYLQGSHANADGDKKGYALGLTWGEAAKDKPGSLDLFVKYYDQPRGTFYAHADDANYFDDTADNTGFKGWSLGADYAIAKNMVVKAVYYDTKEKGGANRDDQRIWTDLTITF